MNIVVYDVGDDDVVGAVLVNVDTGMPLPLSIDRLDDKEDGESFLAWIKSYHNVSDVRDLDAAFLDDLSDEWIEGGRAGWEYEQGISIDEEQ